MRGVDLSIFEFDYDMQWFAFFMNADGAVLGRFGGRDADTPGKYHSLAGLRHSMKAALALHRSGSVPKRAARKPIRAEDYPAAEKRPDNACIHCHHVHEFRRDFLQREGRWNLDEVFIYPQPENIGLTLDVDQGNRVCTVAAKSAAAKLGLAANDVLHRINDVPIASIADVQYALHKTPKKGTIAFTWQRDKEERKAMMPVAGDWRETDVSWRWSLKSMAPQPSIIGDDLDADGRKNLGLNGKQFAFRQMNFLTPVARHAGLQANDVIVGINDRELMMNARQFEAHIRLRYKVGDEIAFNVIRGKERVQVKMKLPE